jgi:hypothetical protein
MFHMRHGESQAFREKKRRRGGTEGSSACLGRQLLLNDMDCQVVQKEKPLHRLDGL